MSARGDARSLTQTSKGVVVGAWDRDDDRSAGVYCSNCGNPSEVDIDALELADRRIDFVPPEEFSAESLAGEFLDLRPDATWNRIEIPGRSAQTASLETDIAAPLLEALERTGRLPLYTHQVHAIDASRRGRHVVQATSAGSGKSLGFLVPVLHELVESPTATATLVFPLRALANDQLHAIAALGVRNDPWVSDSIFDLELAEGGRTIRVGRYDGSTLDHERKPVRQYCRLLVTTPDSIHASLLRMATRKYGDGSSWERFLRGLRYVVLDEIHSYRGVFGSNVAQVVRRLRRAAAWYGSDPSFLAASATIGNPIELAEKLTGLNGFELVEDDGSPQRARTVLICNPPVASDQAAKKSRATAGLPEGQETRLAPQTVALELVAAGALGSAAHLPVRTICFERSRNQVSALTKRVQGRLADLRRADLAPMVASYTATLLSDDREATEGSLRDGTLLAVVSTNALELGIDIPDLSVAVLCGYPGQIASFRQRAGRVGRTGEGLVILIVGDDPLQQHLAQQPKALSDLLAGRAEDVVINPEAPEIRRRYGLSPGQTEIGGIAYEDERFFGKEAVEDWLAGVSGPPAVDHEGVPYWSRAVSETEYLGLRDLGGSDPLTVYAVAGREREAIGVLDAASGPRDAFVPAIWSGPKGRLYRVTGFDPRRLEIYCEGPVNVGYLTRGVSVDTVEVLGEPFDSRQAGPTELAYSELRITRWVHTYKEMNFAGTEQTHQVQKKWPPTDFDTQGLYVRLDSAWLTGAWDRNEAVKGLEHVLLALAPAVVACDPYDIDATSDGSTVYVYDSFGGGIGITRSVFDRLEEVVQLGLDTVRSCGCKAGCPGCIVLTRRPDGNRNLSKPGALALLQQLADAMDLESATA